jgi:hypothetical protein
VVQLSQTVLTRPGQVNVQARVEATVTKAEFYRDGQLIGSDTQAPFEITDVLTAPEKATRLYTVKAFTGDSRPPVRPRA